MVLPWRALAAVQHESLDGCHAGRGKDCADII